MAEAPNVKRSHQQIAGAVMALVCLGMTVWIWHTALTEGYFYPKASILFPALFIVCLGTVLFPNYKLERIARGEDISELGGWRLITARWWVILVFGLLAGFANLSLLYFL